MSAYLSTSVAVTSNVEQFSSSSSNCALFLDMVTLSCISQLYSRLYFNVRPQQYVLCFRLQLSQSVYNPFQLTLRIDCLKCNRFVCYYFVPTSRLLHVTSLPNRINAWSVSSEVNNLSPPPAKMLYRTCTSKSNFWRSDELAIPHHKTAFSENHSSVKLFYQLPLSLRK